MLISLKPKDVVTLFLSAADVLLGWGPLAVLILTTFVKSLFTRSSSEKTQTSLGSTHKQTLLASKRLSPTGKCWLEQHCTLWTFPKADCCGLSALPRKGGSCRPLILATLSFVKSLPLVISLISLSGAACTFKIYSCSASTCSILSTKSAEASKWAEEKPTGFPSSRHMTILNIPFETPCYILEKKMKIYYEK